MNHAPFYFDHHWAKVYEENAFLKSFCDPKELTPHINKNFCNSAHAIDDGDACREGTVMYPARLLQERGQRTVPFPGVDTG